MTEAEWIERVLQYNPFADDKDDGGYRLLSDKVVRARAGGECCECLGPVVPGTLIRVQTAVGDGQIVSARTCHVCCEAEAACWDDNCAAMLERHDMGRAEADRRVAARREALAACAASSIVAVGAL